MRISAIGQSSVCAKNFKGEWKERRVGNFYANSYYTECSYHPDKDETLKDIAIAWGRKTGDLPSQWIRKNNIYNQQGEKHYQVSDCYYMPLELIKASLEIEKSRMKGYGSEDSAIIEIARVAKQTNDKETVKKCEDELVEIAKNQHGAKYQSLMEERLNNYKDGMGSEMYRRR